MGYLRRRGLTASIQRSSFIIFAILCTLIVYAIFTPQLVDAGSNRLGTPQVTLNPGGGILDNGTDGLRFTINGDDRYTDQNYDSINEGQDGLVYRATRQYCCSGGGPMLNIGGQLYGQTGPGMDAEDWSSIQIISTSGAASVGARTSNTGNSSATIRYTIEKNDLTYIIDRTVSYLYPNDFVTDSYSFVIPQGNTDQVKFYLGGDTAPGSSDQGYGIMLTQPVRSIISLNTSSQIMYGLREVQGSRPFDGATSQHYYTPYSIVNNGGNIGFVGTASNHDAGLMMQWNLGSTPGTYTGTFEQFVTQQGTNLNAVFAQPRADIDEGVSLNISIVNSELENIGGLGYTLTLPTGVTINATATSNCGGTLAAVNGSDVITLSGVTINAASNCVVSVPVSAANPGSYAVTSSNATNITGALVNNIGVSRLNVAVYNLSYATQGGDSINDGVYELGNQATLPSSTRSGFIFQGWNTNADNSGTSYAAGDTITMPANDITLYAQWQPIPYSLTFDTQGGSTVNTLNDLTAGDEVSLTSPTRAGYIFDRWSTNANGTGTSYQANSPFTVPAANTTLYAIWAKSVTLAYNTHGGNNINSVTLREGNNTWTSGAPTRSGYNFVEWNTEPSGNGTSYQPYNQLTMSSNDITLHAIWEDSDGIDREIENDAPNDGDANNDGILDSQQANVSSFINSVTGKPVSLELTSDDECFLNNVSVKASSELADDSDYTYPLGLLDFSVECGNNGFTATVKQHFYDASIDSFTLRKYLDGQYSTVTNATFDMQTISGRQVLIVSYDVTDGGQLDADGEVNGVVVDPAGPAVSVATPIVAPAVAANNTSASSGILGAPNTGIESKDMTILLVLGSFGIMMISLALTGALRTRFNRG